MTGLKRHLSHVKPAAVWSASVVAVVAIAAALFGLTLTAVVDALFLIAVAVSVVAMILTRPTVSRRRAIRRAADDDASDEDDEPPLERSRGRDPVAQFRTGVRLVLVAAALLGSSLLVQIVAL